MEFESVEAYVRAYSKDRSLAVMPVPMAADLFGITGAGIVSRVRNGVLGEIRISGTRYVTMGSVLDAISKTDREVEIVKAYLEQQARHGVVSVEYAPVMELLGLSSKLSADRTKIGWILGEVSRRSYREKGVLLSVVVHRKNTSMPSENGFFGLVNALIEDWEDHYNDRESFVEAETKRVLKAYRK
ncbi:hypothetical protein [Paracoccus denitrificans]|uniref:DNA-binding protein n=1 Tax=Paracoccus denitrificans (strain Pd 1222) TaxID=318586 RepID=A1B4B1_PARDP|nr:hypothetical protein [Paracoccus denitrificans]ABL70355.1 hypothetical protein Pden_2263 [Paracoccus denitrificans PD1222]MBB4627266.1 hypothetical protein [Paracoccus denitrificans]MCU7427961.1 hypothetical protein [Paracoccus denitrificans]QAR25704.1 hypothetical protein EO213_04990 [Paracoccus denitrificans]UFS65564.1 hypothetical protein LO749_03080 [Paracoccus denitrificans]